MAAIARPASSTRAAGRRLLFAGLVAFGLFILALLLVFVWPSVDSPQTHFDLGPVDGYRIGSVTTVPEGKFHLVRLSEHEFIALSWVDPQGGCTVPWRPAFQFRGEHGWFRNPC